jgi:hypothetical protein
MSGSIERLSADEPCATDGCGNMAVFRFESGGVGSAYCDTCAGPLWPVAPRPARGVGMNAPEGIWLDTTCGEVFRDGRHGIEGLTAYVRADLHADALRAAREALAAIERLATNLGIASCSCGIKSPDIQWHAGHCPYVLVTYILVQAEDALAALDREEK